MIDEIEFIKEKITQLEWFKEYFSKESDELNIIGSPKKESVDDMLDMYNRILSVLKQDRKDKNFESISVEDALKP